MSSPRNSTTDMKDQTDPRKLTFSWFAHSVNPDDSSGVAVFYANGKQTKEIEFTHIEDAREILSVLEEVKKEALNDVKRMVVREIIGLETKVKFL